MQDINVRLQDSQLEQAVLRLAKQQHQNLQEFVISALSYYIEEKEKPMAITVQNLDPFQHSKAVTESFQKPEGLAFSDIEESVAFAKNLRQQAWQRNE
ncbi:MAG: hypothetical protein GQ569_02045 [Methylococcaceae bacterium]|nr:hypothetical protein [Methylococcaceae bacterium]